MAPTSIAWIFLIGSIATEVLGMIALRYSNGFSKLLPTSLTIALILTSLWLMALSLKHLELGMTYAIWAASSTAIIALIGFAIYAEAITSFKVAGIVLIVIGVVLLNLTNR